MSSVFYFCLFTCYGHLCFLQSLLSINSVFFFTVLSYFHPYFPAHLSIKDIKFSHYIGMYSYFVMQCLLYFTAWYKPKIYLKKYGQESLTHTPSILYVLTTNIHCTWCENDEGFLFPSHTQKYYLSLMSDTLHKGM